MTDRGVARTAGVLFLVSMTVSIAYTSAFSGALEEPLATVSAHRARVVTGAMLELVNCFAVVGIAITLHAILKRHSGRLALGYVSLRAIESAILIAGVVAGLSLVAVGESWNAPPALRHPSLEAVAVTLLAGKELALQMGILTCGLGGLLLTSMLYRLRLVPRPISVLGLIGYVAVVASVVLSLYGVIDTREGSGRLLYVPGGLFEALVFPLWLIFKGFSSPLGLTGTS